MSPTVRPSDFDPGSAAGGDGLFGLPTTVNDARVVVVPAPFEATVSYGDGTANAPAAVLAASRQVDLFDPETGRPYEQGIAMLDLADAACIRAWSDAARKAALPVLASGGPDGHAAAIATVDDLCDRMNDWVAARSWELQEAGKTVFVLGGDHSVPFGTIAATAERHPGIGILHLDAHFDLRPAYEGFAWSHASVMHNVLTQVPGVGRIVHVGIRDLSEEELGISRASGDRSVAFLDHTLRERRDAGEAWGAIAADIVEQLPETVYLSFDVDGLDPALCPGTGTPVPGGLDWHQISTLLAAVARSGRRIVGGDLVEVAPTAGDREWNANVGARLLYKMIGWSLRSLDA